MSVATKSYVASYENNRHTDEMSQRPPRSPASTYNQSSQRISTPSNEPLNPLKRPFQDDENDRHREKRLKTDSFFESPDVKQEKVEIKDAVALTNHDRLAPQSQDSKTDASTEQQEIEATSSKTNSKPLGGPAWEQQRHEVKVKSTLYQSALPQSLPNPNQHLMVTYGLGSLLRSVARTDPSTGEKKIKLRKSYEGQIKSFALPGRNKAREEKRDPDTMIGPLRHLAIIPEYEYRQKAPEANLAVTEELRSKLQRAMQLNPGTMRDNSAKEDILGHEKRPMMMGPQTPVPVPSRLLNGQRPLSSSAQLDDRRGTRGNKRSYRDSSFVGYGEGYSDVDNMDSDGDFDQDRKKRKKDLLGRTHPPHHPHR